NPLNPPYSKGDVTPLKVRGEGGVMKSYRIIGHEFFGEVVEVGKGIKNLKKGDFVSCESHVVCNKCYQCLRGEKHVCTQEKILGISQDGGFAEYVRVPGHIVWKTDTSKIRPEVAAVQEPFGNAVHAASKVDLKGKSVAIFGLGPIGLFLLLIAKGMGAKEIIGVEPNPIAIEMAKKLGIDYVIPLKTPPLIPPLKRRGTTLSPSEGRVGEGLNFAHNPEVTDEIMKITGGRGADVSFEMAGFNNSFNNAIFATRRGGEVILFGIKTGDFILEDYNRLIVRGLTLHAVIGRQIWQTWENTRSLLENPKNKIQEQIYKVILNEGRGTILPISEYTKEKFEKMMQEHPKFLIQF
ncbi:MAG: alcohol dehydrogenase catalytic domain-containing protein, partial [bacterium]|nr:alcohol dehydrogenase catalytic domain-containing protein [bacterium]